MPGESEFDRVQREYFEAPEVEHFRWTTGGAGFSETEDELLEPLCRAVCSPCLEIGCGEGNNLSRLSKHARCFGIDLFPKKLSFARKEVPGVELAVSRAQGLPFADASFESVVIRDVLHHMDDPRAVVEEAMRVLAPGGSFFLLEPNAKNPFVALQIWLVPAEAGAKKFSAAYVASLLEGLPLRDLAFDAAQALPLRRVVLHYQMGLPSLGRVGWIRGLLRLLERGMGALIPRRFWSYVVATGTRT